MEYPTINSFEKRILVVLYNNNVRKMRSDLGKARFFYIIFLSE